LDKVAYEATVMKIRICFKIYLTFKSITQLISFIIGIYYVTKMTYNPTYMELDQIGFCQKEAAQGLATDHRVLDFY